jgi:hypothetical protein
MPAKICDACICCIDGCDFENIVLGCKGKGQFCCIVEEACLAPGEDSLGVGCVTNADNNECCKLGLLCCAVGLKSPDTCVKSAGKDKCEGHLFRRLYEGQQI